jgi:hypothetical protein
MTDRFEEHLIKSIDDDSQLTAADLAALVNETERAIITAEADAKLAAEIAYDPARSTDPAVARTAMEDAHLRAGRLRTLLPRLRQRLQSAHDREARTRWQKDHDRLKLERDALASELAAFYPSFAAKLADLFDRIVALDSELSHLNQWGPAGARGHLLGVELTARSLGGFDREQPSLTKQLVLPSWSDSARLLYPPPRPSAAASYAESMAPAYGDHRGANWWRDVEARQAAQRQESERVGRFYADREARREACEDAEAKARAAK